MRRLGIPVSIAGIAVFLQGFVYAQTPDWLFPKDEVIGGGYTAEMPVSIYAADLDGDGDLDALASQVYGYPRAEVAFVLYFENGGDPKRSLVPRPIEQVDTLGREVHAADLDGDGDLDVLAALSSKFKWYENQGGSPLVFVPRELGATSGHGQSIHAADLDGDGDFDVVAGSSSCVWFENDGHGNFTERFLADRRGDSVRVADVDEDLDPDILVAGDSLWIYENLGNGQFQERLLHGTGGKSIDAADFDGDSDMDIAAAGAGIRWFRNLGNFTFETLTITGNNSDHIHAVDVDNNGSIDLLSAQGSTYWYRNDGFGSFQTNFINSNGREANSVFGIDFDGDGDVDVLETKLGDCHGGGCEGSEIAWNENVGTVFPSFVYRFIGNAAIYIREAAVLDFDQDDDLDVMIYQTSEVQWFENNGDAPPGFGPRSLPRYAAFNSAFNAVDLNADSFTDILTVVDGFRPVLSWMQNVGTAIVSPRPILTTNGFGSLADFDTGHLNTDGHLDIVTAGSVARWLESNGAAIPTFTDRVISATPCHFANTYDVDGDLDTDIVVGSRTGDWIDWHENNGAGNFTRHSINRSFHSGPSSVFAIDLDKDGDLDAVTCSERDNRVAWHENLGGTPPAFKSRIISNVAMGAQAVYAADVNGDGHIDVLSASKNDDKIAWYQNNGAQPPSFTTRVISTNADEASSVFAHDLDGDGDMDVVSASARDNKIAWYRNNGNAVPTFQQLVISTAMWGASSVFTADIDGDGDIDILAGATHDDKVSVFRNDGLGIPSFLEQVVTTSANGVFSVHSADMDGDGDLDLLSASAYDRTVAWYENNGANPPVFTPQIITTAANGAWSVYAKDIDGDGDMDAVSGSFFDNKIAWYENNGDEDPLFETKIVSLDALEAVSVFVADIDGDGNQDLLSASLKDNKVSWYENDGAENFTEQFISYNPITDMRQMRTADLDNDGDGDIVAMIKTALFWLENDGAYPPQFTIHRIGGPDSVDGSGEPASFCLEWPWCRLELGDADLDGFIDIFVSSYADGGKIVRFENDGGMPPGFTPRVIETYRSFINALELADMDGDGDLDIVFGSEDNPDRVGWIQNLFGEVTPTPTSTPTETFTPTLTFTASLTPTFTRTPSITPTPTPTFTVQFSPTPSQTWTPSLTPTETPSATVTPTPSETPTPAVFRRSDLNLDKGVDSLDLMILAHDWKKVSAPTLGSVDYLTEVHTAEEFEGLTVEGGGRFDIRREGKYWCPATEEAALSYPTFQNVNLHPFHPNFLQNIFPDLFSGFELNDFFQLILRNTPRQYFAGGIFSFETADGGTVYGFDSVADYISPLEVLTQGEAAEIYNRLSAVFRLQPFAYTPVHPVAVQTARGWNNPPFPVYLPGDTVEVDYEAYTLGTNYGRVRILTLEELDNANRNGLISWQDILVLDLAPFDIEGVQAAIVTGSRQGELSHVALRTARRGTPNAFVRNPHEAFAPYTDQLVRLTFTEEGYSIDPNVTLAEALAWWDEHRPTAPLELAPNVEYATLTNVLAMDVSEMEESLTNVFGGKVAGLARMYSYLPAEHQVPAFGVPFRHYKEFMESNFMDVELEKGKTALVSYQAYVDYLLADPLFQTDGRYRAERLAFLRNEIEENGKVDTWFLYAMIAKIEEVYGATNVMVRTRSSSNSEDSLLFNGAGLYDSASSCAADTLDGDTSGPSHCNPNEPRERTLERGLKRVWASLWNFRAYEEREYYQIPHDKTVMGVLVSLAFPDEASNGVAFTGDPAGGGGNAYVINVQLGDVSTVQPEVGILPELVRLEVADGELVSFNRIRPSSLVPEGEWVLSEEQLRRLGAAMALVDANQPIDLEGYRREDVLFDIEFKFTHEGALIFKQIRPFLRPGASLLPPPVPMLNPRSDINRDRVVDPLDLEMFLRDRLYGED